MRIDAGADALQALQEALPRSSDEYRIACHQFELGASREGLSECHAGANAESLGGTRDLADTLCSPELG
ncbi:MAG: hypothetical protein NVSMB51_05470 [Solirubrobacteraceae bacterium]